MVFCRVAHVLASPLHSISHCSSTSCFGCALSENIWCGLKDLSWWNPSESIQCGLLDLSESITGAKVFGVNWRINPTALPTATCCFRSDSGMQSAQAAGAPKRIRGSAACSGSGAGFEADPVMRSHCSTWQNTSLKEPSEDTEPYPWRMPIPTEALEPASAPLPVGPIVMFKASCIKTDEATCVANASTRKENR